jgi:hypothetical protein
MVLVAALVAAVIGFGTTAKWLFIIAIVLLVVGVGAEYCIRAAQGASEPSPEQPLLRPVGGV